MPSYLKHLIRLGLWPYIIFIINYASYNLFPFEYYNYQLDIPMHILGGTVAVLSINYALQLLQKQKTVIISNLLIKWIFLIAMAALIAVLWEFYEFTADYFFGTLHQPTLFDTIKDLFNGLAGAILTCLLFVRNKK